MQASQHRIIQVSDLHLLADRKEIFLGTNPFDNFSAVMELVKKDIQQNAVELLMFSGDVSQDYSPESYRDFCSVVRDVSIPMVWIPGNHDDLQIGQEILANCNVHFTHSFHLNSWKIILLNSLWSGHIAGSLTEDELAILDGELKKTEDQSVMIVVHHHPILTHCPWLDDHVLKNADDFFAVMNHYSHVRAVLFGHIHAVLERLKNEVSYLSAPATVFQFDIKKKEFQLADLMPGYRWLELGGEGAFATGVNRLSYSSKWLPNLKSEDY